ncbi:MAG: RNA polymerase sigma-54 factor, partial [Pseudomonadota bacterium]
MSMKQSIQLKLGQHLTMTPQLQQAIRLLQLSSLELTAEVQDALDSNMMLEVDEGGEGDAELGASESGSETDEQLYNFESSDEGDVEARGTTEDIPQDMPVDSEWDEVYDSMGAGGAMSVRTVDSSAMDFESVQTADTNLIDHLEEQLNLLPMSDTDRAIALILIDSLDDYGYLQVDFESVIDTLASAGIDEVEIDEVEAVLKRINHLDPIGVGARDLGECLLLQLETYDPDTKWIKEAKDICRHYIDLLGSRNYRQVTRKLRVSEDELREILSLIQSLNPRPGEVFNEKPPEYVVPDAYVRKIRGEWVVTLNTDSLPQLRVNPFYASLIRRADNSSDNSSLKTHLQEAKWFIKSLQSRSDTLLRVASE